MSLWHRLWKRPSRDESQGAVASLDVESANASDNTIPGDRGVSPTHRVRSAQSRLTNALALGMGAVVLGGFLVWYYKNALAERSRERDSAQAETMKKAQGDMVLPAIGRVDAPVIERALGPPPPPVPQDASMLPVTQQPSARAAVNDVGRRTARPAAGRERDVSLERRLGGPVFVSASMRKGVPSTASASDERHTESSSQDQPRSNANDELAAMLEPTVTPTATASVLPTRRLLLAKGSFLDCTLETAIDSSLPGMTTCITATDTFGADGSVVLLERGTKLIGETRGSVRQGTRRLFVLWTEARTPTGVVVPLASPGTDELGRSGLPGEVDRHFWDRFGAAILISIIDGAVQGAVQRSSDGGTVIINSSGSQDIMTEVLRSTIQIPPTLTKANGDRIAVLVARDLDFRSVYELRPTANAQ